MKKEKFKKYRDLFKGNKKYVFLIIFLLIIDIIINIAYPILAVLIIDMITKGDTSNLAINIFFIFLISFADSLKRFFQDRINISFSNKVIIDLKNKVLFKISSLKINEFDKNTTGNFSNRINKDIMSLPDNMFGVYANIKGIIINSTFLVAIFIINFYIGILFSVTIVVIGALKNYKSNYRRKYLKIRNTKQDQNSTLTTEFIRGIRDILKLNLISNFKNRLIEKSNELVKLEEKKVKKFSVIDLFSNSFFDIFVCTLIFILVYFVSKDILSVSVAVVIYQYKYQVFNLVYYYDSFTRDYDRLNNALDRIYDILDNDKFKSETYGDLEILNPKGEIEFNNVSFGYNDNNVLKGLSFKIDSKDTVALVGKSGGGKSTIFNLLTKTYSINSGSILVDKVDINNLTQDSLRNNISIISQDPYIFNMTIKENLKLVDENLSDDDMIKYCTLACMHEYIDSLPDKYDTLIGEGGVNLSGGQKQRLAIARALIKKSTILLLDEATSALDNETQSKIKTTIDNITKDYTVLIIAHRLSTIKGCNKIFVVDDGKIVDSGTHEYLMKNCDKYIELYESENL